MTTKGQEIWISSNDSILTYHSENHAITFKCKLPTTRHYANAILVDKSARCWIGTPKGLYLYEETKPLQEVLTNIHIQSLYQDSKRNVWISTRGSGLFKIDPKITFHCSNITLAIQTLYQAIWFAALPRTIMGIFGLALLTD